MDMVLTMYPNVTFAHNNGTVRVDREVKDYNAHARESALGYGRSMRSARTGTVSRRNPVAHPHRYWRYRKFAGGNAPDGDAFDDATENQRDRADRDWYVAMKMRTGVKPRNRAELDEMLAQLTPEQDDEMTELVDRRNNAMQEQTAARDAARPYEQWHADRVSNWQKRNPGRDKPIDPAGNPNEQQRLALEQSARFLPAELLHMIRPDRKPQQPLAQHPGYNSIPARTIRDRNAQAIPANYVHN